MTEQCYHYGIFKITYKNGIKIVVKNRNKKQKQRKKACQIFVEDLCSPK